MVKMLHYYFYYLFAFNTWRWLGRNVIQSQSGCRLLCILSRSTCMLPDASQDPTIRHILNDVASHHSPRTVPKNYYTYGPGPASRRTYWKIRISHQWKKTKAKKNWNGENSLGIGASMTFVWTWLLLLLLPCSGSCFKCSPLVGFVVSVYAKNLSTVYGPAGRLLLFLVLK